MRTIGVSVSLALVAMVSAVVGGCSNDASPRERAATGMSLDELQVSTRGQLPVCDASNEAALAYVVDEKQIVACLDGQWQQVIFPDAPRGDKGEAGDKGDAGDKGETGYKGAKGATGDKGETGPQGEIGDKGALGIVGAVGDKGLFGDKGATGDKGEKGDTGETGDKGEKGDAGPTGDKGPTGPQGETGDKGEKGDAGVEGDKGDAGSTGYTSLVKSSVAAEGTTNCEGGGIRIDAGLDTNRNGILDGAEITQTAWLCKDAPPVRSRIIFMTAGKWTGNLGGVSGAHAKCQLAKGSNPTIAGKNFKALIGSSTTKPSDYLLTDGKFVRMDGTVVAKNWTQLLSSSTLDATINQDQFGTVYTYSNTNQVWTGVVWGATASPNTCLNWTTSTSDFNIAKGHTGTAVQTWHSWFNQGAGTCDYARALYCIEE